MEGQANREQGPRSARSFCRSPSLGSSFLVRWGWHRSPLGRNSFTALVTVTLKFLTNQRPCVPWFPLPSRWAQLAPAPLYAVGAPSVQQSQLQVQGRHASRPSVFQGPSSGFRTAPNPAAHTCHPLPVRQKLSKVCVCVLGGWVPSPAQARLTRSTPAPPSPKGRGLWWQQQHTGRGWKQFFH